MSEKSHNIQDMYLNALRKKKLPLTVFLTNGVKLQGIVGSFDNFSVVLKRSGHTQLIYKHAIATVVPTNPFSLADVAEANGTPMTAAEKAEALAD
jgi:host factor-I protein